ncbi:PepSY-like domain-containing protein [Ensifer sp. BR816]|uniref:PepSY-like domain-containing protein n=1 Tax=Rhizobium sp. (strain BR816) TaxID=1057002 RepID=UPI0003648A78|nr:PepSY-like domain-containing protein [Ensifer sp. BR816]
MKLARHYVALGALAFFLPGATDVSAEEQEIACEKVPSAVRDVFDKAYPKATIKACAEEVENGELVYEIESIEGETARDVSYDRDGGLLVVEESMPMEAVPQAVRTAVNTKFAGGKIKLAEKLMRDGKESYELQIAYQGRDLEAVFDPDGTEVKE